MLRTIRVAIGALAVIGANPSLGASALPSVTLDCSVARVNPLVDEAAGIAAEILRQQRYRFEILTPFQVLLVTVSTPPTGEQRVVQAMSSDSAYQFDFDGTRVMIDRRTGSFEVGRVGARIAWGSGECTRIGERKF